MNKNKLTIQKMTGMALLLALTVVLQFSASYIFKFTPVEINLALIPIIIAAMLYGPIEGMLVGLMNGLLVIFNDGTKAFMVFNPVGTIITCLVKTALAGLLCGIIYRLISKKNDFVASIVGSVIVPFTNTFLFFIGCLIFFVPLFGEDVSESLKKIATMIFAINSLIEIVSISILCPIIYRIVVVIKKMLNKEGKLKMKEIDFKNLSKPYFEKVDTHLKEFVAINSVYDEETKSDDAPYGKGVKNALNYALQLGKQYGFESKLIDNRCVELTIGEGKTLVGIFAHADVVPATGKWTSDPFRVRSEDGNMYGRGVSDDKGPLLASFFATKLLADNGLIKNYRVRIVIGGDEERGGSCLEHYFKDKNREIPDYGFTPDADFPVVYGEKGISNFESTFDVTLSNVSKIKAGIVANAVIDKADVTLIKKDEEFVKYLKDNKVDFDVNDNVVTFNGKSAHGSTPEEGINAALIALTRLAEFYKNEKLLTFVNKLSDTTGEAYGCRYKTNNLGETTYNVGLLSYENSKITYTTNTRFPETVVMEEMIKDYDKNLLTKTNILWVSSYLLFDRKSPLVAKLMEAYQKETGDMKHGPFYQGGGTYAKEAKNTVAFGACFPGENTRMHEPDEFMNINNLHKCISIYAHAIYLLGKN